MNSNTFQDQPDSKESYKFGSLNSVNDKAREYAVEHNKEVIKIGKQLGSKALPFGWQMEQAFQDN